MEPNATSLGVSILALALSALATFYAARQSRAARLQAEAGMRQADAAELANRLAHDAAFELVRRGSRWQLKNIGSGIAYQVYIEPAAKGATHRRFRAATVTTTQAVVLVGWEELTADGRPGRVHSRLLTPNVGTRVQSRQAAVVRWLQLDGIVRTTVVEYPFAPQALPQPAARKGIAR